MRDQISFNEIIERKNELDYKCKEYNPEFYAETKRIGGNMQYAKFKCKNPVFRFANAYVAEMCVKYWLEDSQHIKLDYLDRSHDVYEIRAKYPGPDLINRYDGVTFEVKCGRHTVEDYDFTLNDNHNATYTIFYDRKKKALFLMDYVSWTYKKIIDFTINLPFMNY